MDQKGHQQKQELTIFCPQCHDLILDRPACPACGWQRPLAAGDAGMLVWQGKLGC